MRQRWSDSVGEAPFRVVVYERRDKGDVLWLRWRDGGNNRQQSLGRKLRHRNGRIDPDTRRWAVAQAEAKRCELEGSPDDRIAIGDLEALVTNNVTGLYPRRTNHRDEVVNALLRVERVLGRDKPVEAVTRHDIRVIGRRAIDELRSKGRVGLRGAEIAVSRFLTVTRWVREDLQAIPITACMPHPKWKEQLREDWQCASGESHLPEPNQPRYSQDEVRSLLEAAHEIDPRFGLLLELGFGLRLGQVVRCRRHDYRKTEGKLDIPGGRNKRGTTIVLSPQQLKAVEYALDEGYLSELERAALDFPLFPGGQLAGGRKGQGKATERHIHGPIVSRRQRHRWFEMAEQIAGVEHVSGRGAHGIRRLMVDAADTMNLSGQGVKALGGWQDEKTPRSIYRKKEPPQEAMEEAMTVRREVRGGE